MKYLTLEKRYQDGKESYITQDGAIVNFKECKSSQYKGKIFVCPEDENKNVLMVVGNCNYHIERENEYWVVEVSETEFAHSEIFEEESYRR